ncbi:MAG: DUF4340 domain-containing protein [Spirochaetales bacterium]|nr:DUF4340 domain-containing protein [Spirochaetales bacterium]
MRVQRRIRALAATLAILLVALAATWVAWSSRERHDSGRLFDGDPARVARVEIEDRGRSIVLVRHAGTWAVLDGALPLPARAVRVEALLAGLSALRRLEVAASTESGRARLGLAEGAATLRLIDLDGALLFVLRSGDLGSDGRSIFVSIEGRPEAWSTDRDLASYLDPARRYWLELAMGGSPARAEEATALGVSGALVLDGENGERFAADYRLKRGPDGRWSVDGGRGPALDQDRVDSLVRMVLGLEADDLAGKAGDGAREADLSISLELGSDVRAWRIREAAEGFEIETDHHPWSFVADAARLRSVLVGLDALAAD